MRKFAVAQRQPEREQTTVVAAEMLPGRIYKHTRNPGGVYYARPPAGTAVRLVDKYKRATTMKLNTTELATYRAALAELRGEMVLARRFIRGMADGERYEVQDLVGLPSDYRLRCVSSKPGYDGLVL